MSDYNAYLKRAEARIKSNDSPLAYLTSSEVFTSAFNLCDQMNNYSNFVPLSSLRMALGGTRESQDATITAARASGLYSLAPCDRYIDSVDRATAYTDAHGDTFHYISRRDS